MVCPKRLESPKLPELSLQYMYDFSDSRYSGGLHSAAKISLPFGFHRFMFIQEVSPNEAFATKIEKEVCLEPTNMLNPEKLLSILPGMTRTDRGQGQTSTFQGRISYLCESIVVTTKISLCQNRQSAKVAVDSDTAEAKACHNALLQIFKPKLAASPALPGTG